MSEPMMQVMPDGVIAPVITLRDYFAAHALAGWLASFPEGNCTPEFGDAAMAYRMADLMLEARQPARGGAA